MVGTRLENDDVSRGTTEFDSLALLQFMIKKILFAAAVIVVAVVAYLIWLRLSIAA